MIVRMLIPYAILAMIFLLLLFVPVCFAFRLPVIFNFIHACFLFFAAGLERFGLLLHHFLMFYSSNIIRYLSFFSCTLIFLSIRYHDDHAYYGYDHHFTRSDFHVRTATLLYVHDAVRQLLCRPACKQSINHSLPLESPF